MQENDKRQAVFLTLVRRDEPLTPSAIGDAIDERRNTVKYHLDKLVDQGLVIREDGAYRPQPVFTDDDFETTFVDTLGALVPDFAARIETDPHRSGEEQAQVVFNCVEAYVAMELLGDRRGENTDEGAALGE